MRKNVIHRSRAAAIAALLTATVFAVTGCGATAASDTATDSDEPRNFVVSSYEDGYRSEALKWAAENLAADYGITIEPRFINDEVKNLSALDEGEVDLGFGISNVAYLSSANVDGGYDFYSVVPIDIETWSLRSTKHDDAADIADGGTILIDKNPTNTSSSLLILQDAGLITLNDEANSWEYTLDDIVSNPKNLVIQPFDIFQIGRSLPDVEAAVSANSVWLGAGYGEDDVLAERTGDPLVYATTLAVTAENVDNPDFQPIYDLFSSQEFADYVSENLSAVGVAPDRETVENWVPTNGSDLVSKE